MKINVKKGQIRFLLLRTKTVIQCSFFFAWTLTDSKDKKMIPKLFLATIVYPSLEVCELIKTFDAQKRVRREVFDKNDASLGLMERALLFRFLSSGAD